jgi:hypothetical protein
LESTTELSERAGFADGIDAGHMVFSRGVGDVRED